MIYELRIYRCVPGRRDSEVRNVEADANANVPAQSGQPLIPAKCSGDNKERWAWPAALFLYDRCSML
ncbi:hypothetical protein [Mesorhizobium sp. M1227]|uniref:hypothetical protein n=1 Tax=unclassified Mesorhizobium TaxID=325217 RepID=UPI0033356A02